MIVNTNSKRTPATVMNASQKPGTVWVTSHSGSDAFQSDPEYTQRESKN